MNESDRYPTISAEKLKNLLETSSAPLLLHTLPADHFASARLPGARNACVFEVAFPRQIADIVPSRETPVVVYGAGNAMDADVAAEKMMRLGYAKVTVFEGGIAAWKAAGYPLEGDAPEKPDQPEPIFRFQDGVYPVNPKASWIHWTGRNANGRHHGTVSLSEGAARVRNGEITGSFEVDMTTIENINLAGDELQPVLIDHLKSDDFFFVKRFPKAVFSIQSVIPLDDATATAANYEITGNLILRGISRSIRFPATVNPLEDGGFAAEAHFDIDRTRWSIIYGSARFFKHLGMHKVYDTISYEVRLVFAE